MSTIIQGIIRLVILACLVGGIALIVKTREDKISHQKKIEEASNNTKALALKKFLLTFNKPERIEIFNYTAQP